MKLHLVIGNDYGDILYWKSNLPQNKFSHYVREILFAEKNGTKANIPVPNEKGEQDGLTDIRIEIRDKDVIRYLRAIPSQKKNETIKKIIRKHLKSAYEQAELKPSKMIPLDDINRALTEASAFISMAEIRYSDSQKRDTLLLMEYESVFNRLFDLFRNAKE